MSHVRGDTHPRLHRNSTEMDQPKKVTAWSPIEQALREKVESSIINFVAALNELIGSRAQTGYRRGAPVAVGAGLAGRIDHLVVAAARVSRTGIGGAVPG